MTSDMMIQSDLATAERVAFSKVSREKIAVVGLGYVGLPLCMALAKHHLAVTGFDISTRRVDTLVAGHDYTGEVEPAALKRSSARLTTNPARIADATFFIVTVPTPIDAENRPDLGPLRSACEVIGPLLKVGDIVVFESTVYPGVTEDVCGPLLAQHSGLRVGIDFNLGYSPERINPGDKLNSVETIVKVVAGDTPETLERMCAVYGEAIHAGVHCAPSIKVAECAKVIENTQRDVNIALMNELASICDKINVRTADVIEAAGTKWNFLKFQPGLVGGHCIGVDPYYLAALAEQLGLKAEVILAGRRVNDGMAAHVAAEALARLKAHRGSAEGARVGVFGLTFKEDVPDVRNSKSFDVIHSLQSHGVQVLAHDPHADVRDAQAEGVLPCAAEEMTNLDLMIVTVAHRDYRRPGFLARHMRPDGVLIDVKSIYSDATLPETASYWSL
jgi:UDP-N-acetyl-D-galactosamine dehydrogenase